MEKLNTQLLFFKDIHRVFKQEIWKVSGREVYARLQMQGGRRDKVNSEPKDLRGWCGRQKSSEKFTEGKLIGCIGKLREEAAARGNTQEEGPAGRQLQKTAVHTSPPPQGRRIPAYKRSSTTCGVCLESMHKAA